MYTSEPEIVIRASTVVHLNMNQKDGPPTESQPFKSLQSELYVGFHPSPVNKGDRRPPPARHTHTLFHSIVNKRTVSLPAHRHTKN